MTKFRATFLTAVSSSVFLAALILATPAYATGTFYVDSTTGNDANNCLSADTPCLTVAGVKTLITALPDPSNTTVKLNGTFTDQISFAKTDVTAPDTLDGLRLTATDQSNQPVLNTAVAGTTAVTITGLDHVTVDHLTITGGPIGIYVIGTVTTYASDINIHHNTVSGISDESSATGIEVLYAKKSSIHHNTIRDVAISFTDQNNYSYLQGLYFGYSDELAVYENTISAFGMTDELTLAGAHYAYVYGVYGTNLTNSTIRDNTLTDLYATEVSSVAGTTHYATTYGMYGLYLVDTVIEDNSVTNVTSTVNADNVGGSYSAAYSGGIMLVDIRTDDDVAVVQNNTIDGMVAHTESTTGNASTYGIQAQYAYNALITNNTINDLGSTFTSLNEDISANASVYGIHGPYYGTGSTVSKNTVSNLTATTNYSGDDSVGNPTVSGIYIYNAQATVTGNVVQDLSRVMSNGDGDAYYDISTLHGINVALGTGSIIKNNRVRNINDAYTSTGTGGTTYLYNSAISVATSDNVVIQNNKLTELSYSTTLNDPTDSSSSVVQTYPIYLSRVSGATVQNNKIKRFTSTANAGNDNTLSNFVYGIYAYAVSGTLNNNRLINADLTSTAVAGGVNQTYTGIYLYATTESAIVQETLVKNVTATATGTTAATTTAGIQVGLGQHVIIEGNQLRPFDTTAAAGTRNSYGIWFAADASQARLLNNIVLGEANFTGAKQIGMYLPSESTLDLDMIHNTVANWYYPVQVDGGSKIYLRNNILAAVGGDSYAIAAGRDELNNDTFKSDYNLLYNTTTAEQLVYDTDNTVAIALADWSNVGGSYGYDVHSLNKAPRLTANGFLKKQSKARNAASNDYPYAKTDVEYGLLQTDVNGTKRPLAQVDKVDIGADEYKK